MRSTRLGVIAVALAGALTALASPAVAEAQTPSAGEPTVKATSVAAIQALGRIKIQNGKSLKYLQPSGGSTTNGTKVVQQSASSSSVQSWDGIGPLDDSFFTFENVASGRNLGIDGASTSSGAAAIIANGSSDINQDWLLTGTPDGKFYIQNRKSHLCLGISGASTANGAQAAQFTCDGTANQTWNILSA